MLQITASALIGLLVAGLISFLTNLTLTIIQIGLAVQAFLPTDVFTAFLMLLMSRYIVLCLMLIGLCLLIMLCC